MENFMGFLSWLLFAIITGLIGGFIGKKKDRYVEGILWGFFLSWIGLIVIASKGDKNASVAGGSNFDNLLLKKDLTPLQLTMIQSEFSKRQKNKGVMYVLWWFTSTFGGHRYYLGDMGYAVFFTLLFLVSITLLLNGIAFGIVPSMLLVILIFVDVFAIGKILDKKNEEIELEIINRVKLYTSDANTRA